MIDTVAQNNGHVDITLTGGRTVQADAIAATPGCFEAISAALLVLAAGCTSRSLAVVESHRRHCANTSGLE